jgi:capsular exopolysaccharide synthesis family protein
MLARQMADLEVELMSLKTKEELVNRQAAMYRRALSGLGSHEQEYLALARGAQTGQNLVNLLNDKLTAARITEQTQTRSLQVVDTATLPRQPSAKASEKILLLGLIGALGLGLGLGTLREWLSQVIETEEDITAVTGLPVLGSVPGIVIRRGRRARAQLRLLGKTKAAPAAPMLMDPWPKNFVKDRDPRSVHAEAFRAIRTTIQLQVPDRPLKTILITSATMSEGKTTVLLNLGLVNVESGRRVLLIDGDLRRPALHQAFGLANERGLADVLQQTIDWTQGCRKVAEGLSVMLSGNTVPNPSSLLNSRTMDSLIQRTGEAADLVLIDSPPVLAVSDSLRLTSLVDAVILVVRAGVTQRRNLIRAKAQLDKVGAPVIGVVINALSSRETRKYYGEYSRYAQRGPRRSKGGA